ncbi:M16 family metallopeptidase [Fibrella aquatilis]|uniref:Insulinase family protein n=1 Tax=Fibrella aquatilis TaxID=2817059 RepID=A0A939GDJ9_9BACT|nr:M16 family metallopeptidase [Fibrella aquatilis]MBO0934731.1 insulinase family protein [Fibrella aquatilis]
MKKTTHFFFCLWLLLTFSGVSRAQTAQQGWKTGTSPGGYTYKYLANDPMQARMYTLKNGLTVLLSVNKKEPRIFTFIPTRAGSNTDPRTNTGLAHYLEHMLFKGTDKFGSLDWAKEKPLLDKVDALYEQYNKTTDEAKRKDIYKQIDVASGEAAKYAIANEYDKMLASMGAQGSNAFTWYEQTVYLEDIPANALDRYLAVQAERFRKPVLRIFHTELEAVYEEKNRSLDNDGNKVDEALMAALFPTHNYGQQTTIGTVEHLKNPSLVEIRNYFDKYYVPNNMAVIMAGDFNPDVVIAKIDKAFAYMKPKPVTLYNPKPEAPLTTVQTREVTGPTPESVRIGYRFPGGVAQNRAVAIMADELMSNSAAGLIDLDLNKQQKILGGGSSSQFMKDYGVWSLYGRPKQGQSLDEVKGLLLGEVAKLKKGDFDATVMQSIVNNYKKRQIETFESNYGRADKLLDAFILSGGSAYPSIIGLNAQLAAVTQQQVIDFANKYLGDNYVVVYKRKGQDKNITKVDKPAITPVEVNREAQSPFLQQVNSLPMSDVQPVWLDYKKDIQRGKAGNAEVLYVNNPDNDLFRLGYRIPMGTYHNKLLPIATQYLAFLSTDKYTAEDISKAFYGLASNYNLYSSGDYTTVQLSGLQENFAKSVALLDHLLRQCKPNEEALASLKERIMKGRSDSKLNKGAIMQGLINYAQYGPKNPYNNQLTNDELKALTSAQLIDVLHTLFDYPQRVIYYGPRPLAALGTDLTQAHQMPTAFRDVPTRQAFVQVAQQKPEVLFADYDMVQSEVFWVRNTASFDPAQLPTVSLFNNYFGGNMASVVFQTLRESKALAYSTYANYNIPERKDQQYSVSAYIGSQADKFNEAVAGMNELLNALPESGKLLETTKVGMKKSMQTERILNDAIIYSYLDAAERGLDYDTRRQTYEALDKLSYADLKTFASTQLANKPYTLCVVASEKRISPTDLAKNGEVKKLTLNEIFGY